MYNKPEFVLSLVAQIGNIQIQWNGQTMEIQALSLPQGSSLMTIFIHHLNRQTLCYVQVGMFKFI